MIRQLVNISKNNSLKVYASIQDWSKDYFESIKDKNPIDQAILGGFQTQQFSYTFLAVYQAALNQMFPSISPNQLKALCVSEKKGNHPKSIETTLIGNKLNGLKTYVTAGGDATHLLVLCKTNEIVNERPLLKIIHLKNDESIKVTNFDVPFMKEVNHGKLELKDVEIESNQILAGDGFSDYAKPFRTLEDICVGAAYQAMFLRQAIENQWDRDVRDQLMLGIHTLKNLIQLPLLDTETIILLSAHEKNFDKLIPDIEKNIADFSSPEFKADWELNKRVLSMAKKTKELRLEKARKNLYV